MLLLQLFDCVLCTPRGRDSTWLSVVVVLSACSGAQLAGRKHTHVLVLTWGCWGWRYQPCMCQGSNGAAASAWMNKQCAHQQHCTDEHGAKKAGQEGRHGVNMLLQWYLHMCGAGWYVMRPAQCARRAGSSDA